MIVIRNAKEMNYKMCVIECALNCSNHKPNTKNPQ